MKVVALVPMKLNNRRLPQKNTKEFTNGKPLYEYILDTLLKVNNVDEIYVYCSNESIKDNMPKGVKFLKREERLDTDTATMNDVLTAFAEDVFADVYVLTHTTAPFISAETIEKGVNAVKENGYDSAFTAKKLQTFLWQDGKPYNYDLDNIPRTQDLPPLYEETCGLYVYKRDVIKNEGRRISKNNYIIEIGQIESTDINGLEDFMIADAIYNYLFKEKSDE